jgi:AcrR family transcriptional regulator
MGESTAVATAQLYAARPSLRPASLLRRASIISATRDLLCEFDVDKIMVADVAERAGVSVATVYNLVGPRDQLLVSVLDDTVELVEARLAAQPVTAGIDGCVSIVVTACDVILSDPIPNRRVLGVLGQFTPELWLISGLTDLLSESISKALTDGALTGRFATEALSTGVQLGFRGALISWVFGQIEDHELRDRAELQALFVLANAVSADERTPVLDRIEELSDMTTEIKTTTGRTSE